jgi:putative NADPH-quinone reductase
MLQMTSKTTVLLCHPNFGKSRANRAFCDAISGLPGIDIVDLYGLYSNQQINVDIEVQRLIESDRLILQFPIQWYSTPPLLKTWQDTVLTRMYYISPETEGNRLRGLPVLIGATAGNTKDAYSASGVNLYPLTELLKPLHSTAHRCGWVWSEPFLIYEANKSSAEVLQEAGQQYRDYVSHWLENQNSV